MTSRCLLCRDEKDKKFLDKFKCIRPDIPKCLLDLTAAEKMCISPFQPVVKYVIFKGSLGQVHFMNHSLTAHQDIRGVLFTLPRAPAEFNLIVANFKNQTTEKTNYSMTIRRTVVLKALKWLIKNNPVFKRRVTIDMEKINALPENGNLLDLLPPENRLDNIQEDPTK